LFSCRGLIFFFLEALLLTNFGLAVLLKLLTLLNLFKERILSKSHVFNSFVKLNDGIDLRLLELFLHQLFVFLLLLDLVKVPLLSLFLPLLLFISLLLDLLTSLPVFFIAFFLFNLSLAQLALHIGHPLDVGEEVILLCEFDKSAIVNISELILLLVEFVTVVAIFFSLLVDFVKLLIIALLGVELFSLGLLKLINLNLKLFDLGSKFTERCRDLLFSGIDGVNLFLNSISLFNVFE